MLTRTGFVTVALSILFLNGCATSQGGSLASRFVTEGEPAVDVGGPPIAAPASRKTARVQPSVAPARTAIAGPTIESADRRLAAALTTEALLPTAESHLLVAREYERLGILDAAYARVDRALQKEPRRSEAHEAKARIWREWGLPGLGLGAAYRAVSYDPRSASAENTLGTLLNALGHADLASEAYKRALSLDPTAAWALSNLCYAAFRGGHLDEAQSWCEKALQISPNLAAAHNNLALTFAADGDLVRARTEFLAAGDPAAAEYNLGIVYLAGRQYAIAADRFEQAIKARPNFGAAKTRAHDARMRALCGGD